ncbi:hypothetical protein PIROE2DRAFT_12827 [Piromyces sp. E2]|nr:hypothetical protein PIROE2DRAFT_12827 [Piromyces sp. E2]|eukprot:OUM61241.1 hypothetical protein PIROE2DRAFT_12827 [Piromyces sp. E2]
MYNYLGDTYNNENAATINWESTKNLSKKFYEVFPDPNSFAQNNYPKFRPFKAPVIDVPFIL